MQNDKKLHLIAGFIISLVGGLIFLPLVVLGFAAGGLKGWWDSRGHGQVEWMDFVWTCVGALAGSIGAVLVKWGGIQ